MKRVHQTGRDGVLVINKPSGPSSNQCLDRLKHGLDQPGLGHAGTLDPLADGVLVVLLGQATKLSPYLMEGYKIYTGRLRLGISTDTFDALGQVMAEKPWQHLSLERINAEIDHWTTLAEQEVPAYSAAKYKGKPLYKMTREGKETPIKIKSINIAQAEVLETDPPWVRFRVRCSSGTYIRSLVHSLGMRLECGATLTGLTRNCSYPFGLEQAVDLDQILAEPESLPDYLIPMEKALPDWPKVSVNKDQAEKILNGMEIRCIDALGQQTGQRAMLLRRDGDRDEPLALAEFKLKGELPVWSILRGLWSA